MQVRASQTEWHGLRRTHQRPACLGGSAARPDPLVLEIAERANAAQADPPPPREALVTLLAQETPEPDAVLQIDEQLLIEAGSLGAAPGANDNPDEMEAPPDAWLRELMASVQLPTLRALSTASLEPLRAAIRMTSEEEEARIWAAYHVLLGRALKLRADRTRGSARARLLIEATRAFDVAYSVYATLKKPAMADGQFAQTNVLEGGGFSRHRPFGSCMGERDGTTLITRVVAGPVGENTHLLERAVTSLRLARASADIKSWTWVSSTNNLACALTLLGNRIPARAGTAMLEEAARVLHEALRAHADGHQREDRGSTLVNLAEALLSMAEREMPGQRVQQVEGAFMASSAALRMVVPKDLLWLVSLKRRELE